MKPEMATYEYLVCSFQRILTLDSWTPPHIYETAFKEVSSVISIKSSSRKTLNEILTKTISDKLDIYHGSFQNLIDSCAARRIFFNYNQKKFLRENITSKGTLRQFLAQNRVSDSLICKVLDYHIDTIEDLQKRIQDLVHVDKKWDSVIESIFSAFIFNLFDPIEIRLHFSHASSINGNYFKFLRASFPEKFNRENALSLLVVNKDVFTTLGDYSSLLGVIFAFIRNSYKVLNNHGHLAILLDSNLGKKDEESVMWRLFSDIVLFGEKHIPEDLNIGYFHPEKIKATTQSYISELPKNVDFKIAYGGFTYKDCYIITEAEVEPGENRVPYSSLILFQKNERDEDVLPCPACYGTNIRGNSYPVIGVKSWECKNPLCPDRSKYNRGKRYSFLSSLKQESISSDLDLIDKATINDWRLDFVTPKEPQEIVAFLLKEFSFYGDTVHIYGDTKSKWNAHGRKIATHPFPSISEDPKKFFSSDFFRRYMQISEKRSAYTLHTDFRGQRIFLGSCKDVIEDLEPNSIAGAVTSPPYYNAKEYTQWPNIYCYLYDMYNHARVLFNALRPGAYYVFNIFDYFDNENILVFSDMGKKRMILGAYIIQIFREIGYQIVENTIWYKGQIQGNRSNNQGNNSPYYQAPLNCYEHIFVFRKPGNMPAINFPTILNVGPVIKIINGQNVLGHTAPYPLAIPNLICSRIHEGTIVDPYCGSGTTNRAAFLYGLNSVSADINSSYCDLASKLLKNQEPSLFD